MLAVQLRRVQVGVRGGQVRCAVWDRRPTFLLMTVPRPSEDMILSSICRNRCSFTSSRMGSPFAVTLRTNATLAAYVHTCTCCQQPGIFKNI